MKTGFFTLGHLCLLLAFSLGMSACNKADDYYAKESLISNIGGPVGEDGGSQGGSADGSAAGGTTGGVAAGSTGGADGGSTGGAAAGGAAGGTYSSVIENFSQNASAQKKLDIMWVIDNSGSMEDEQDELAHNFDVFINDFITKNVDFRMGITTTDARSAYKGLMVPNCDTKLSSAQAQSNPSQFKSDFRSMIQVGINGSGNEKGLEASEGFMSRYAGSTGSFIRSDAYLAVVIVSDEEDQSPKSVQEYADILKAHKANPGLVKIYSIVDVNKTNSGSGITTGGDRYIDASQKTAGIASNIRDDFYQVLGQMGDTIINLLDSFALANQPVAGSLKVFVNDVESNAYTYDAASRSIKFNANAVPSAGAVIKVTYLK